MELNGQNSHNIFKEEAQQHKESLVLTFERNDISDKDN
jgi:hypothetical protein